MQSFLLPLGDRSMIPVAFTPVSTPRFVGLLVHWSVGWSVNPSNFTFSVFLLSLASTLLPKWLSDLEYGPCPPARDWGSRVSGLVFCRPVISGFPLLSVKCLGLPSIWPCLPLGQPHSMISDPIRVSLLASSSILPIFYHMLYMLTA